MRQAHAAGEKLFVDFGGDTVPLPLKLEDCQELFNRRPPDRRLSLVGQYAMRLRQMDLAYGRHVGFVDLRPGAGAANADRPNLGSDP